LNKTIKTMKSAFDLKSARLEALTLRLFTADLAEIAALLDEKAAQYAKEIQERAAARKSSTGR